MHTDMPVDYLGEAVVQRCRKIWWTTYILDRQMTSLMGLPQSIPDEQIHYQLPSFPGSPQKQAGLRMQIKMCRIIAEINSSEYDYAIAQNLCLTLVKGVYGADGRLNRKFLLRTKTALASTADLAHELRKTYDLKLDGTCISGVSRLAAHLHLMYHQVGMSKLFIHSQTLTISYSA